MEAPNRCLQTLSDLFHRRDSGEQTSTVLDSSFVVEPALVDSPAPHRSHQQIVQAQIRAQTCWGAAIATLEQLLQRGVASIPSPSAGHCPGLLLSGPTLAIADPLVNRTFQTGVFTTSAFKHLALAPFQLPAATSATTDHNDLALLELPLLPNDPIASEQFCLVITPAFRLVMMLGCDRQALASFQFSFEPTMIQQAWELLQARLQLLNHPQQENLAAIIGQITKQTPDYRYMTDFSLQLLQHLPINPEFTPTRSRETKPSSPLTPPGTGTLDGQSPQLSQGAELNNKLRLTPSTRPHSAHSSSPGQGSDVKLLKALAHEIRTPLTTIRTLTRLLLKKHQLLNQVALKHLEAIDQECTEQIDRMNLIFRAVELETSPHKDQPIPLTPVSLTDVLQQSIPRWQKQAQRHNVTLDVVIPPTMPLVVSHPAMLDQVLTGLMEKCTHNLPMGGNLNIKITTAGNQLKLQLLSKRHYPSNPLQELGQLLAFQPETGNLSLNMDVTKNLFHALGGKLIVRQRRTQGDVLTLFLPLDYPHSENTALTPL